VCLRGWDILKRPNQSILTSNQGSDFIRKDPSGKHVRLDVNSVLKDKSGAIISYKYSGIIELTPGSAAVLTGNKDAKTTDFGDARKCFFSESE